MIKWKFDKNNSIQQSYQVIPEGYYQVQIEKAVETVSDSGNQMIRMSLNVIGYNVKVRHHLTFSPKHRVLVNKVLSDIYSSFNISVGNLDPQTWIGKIGVAKLEQDNFNGRTFMKVAYFLKKQQQLVLPFIDEDIDEEDDYLPTSCWT